MSLEVWLRRGKKVSVGGKDFYMMPLPLHKLYGIGDWIEENSKGALHEALEKVTPESKLNPLAIVAKVMMKVDVSELAVTIFMFPKDPDTGTPINPVVDKKFFDEYLDIPTAHQLFLQFIEMNQLEEVIKNLKSLPVVKKLMDAASLTFGIPFLSSLPVNTDLTPTRPEGSLSLKSTPSSKQEDIDKLGHGTTMPNKSEVYPIQ